MENNIFLETIDEVNYRYFEDYKYFGDYRYGNIKNKMKFICDKIKNSDIEFDTKSFDIEGCSPHLVYKNTQTHARLITVVLCVECRGTNIYNTIVISYIYDKHIFCSIITSNYLTQIIKKYKNINFDIDGFHRVPLAITDMFANKIYAKHNFYDTFIFLCDGNVYELFETKKFKQDEKYENLLIKYSSKYLCQCVYFDGKKNETQQIINKLLIHPYFGICKISNASDAINCLKINIPNNTVCAFIWCDDKYVITSVLLDNLVINKKKNIHYKGHNGLFIEILCSYDKFVSILDNDDINERVEQCKIINNKLNHYDSQTVENRNMIVNVNPINNSDYNNSDHHNSDFYNTYFDKYIYVDSFCFDV